MRPLKVVRKTQSYTKGKEFVIDETKFTDRGNYVVKIKTKFDSDEKTVNLIIQVNKNYI